MPTELADLGDVIARVTIPHRPRREDSLSHPALELISPGPDNHQCIRLHGLDNCRKLISLLLNACEELEGRLPPGGSK